MYMIDIISVTIVFIYEDLDHLKITFYGVEVISTKYRYKLLQLPTNYGW